MKIFFWLPPVEISEIILNMKTIIQSVRQDLRSAVDDHTRETGQRFFKEKISSYGVKTAKVGKIAKAHLGTIKELKKQEVFEICEELWQSGYLEESFIACQWAYAIRKKFQPEDFLVFEKWVHQYVSNWASCDTLCNHTIGTFVQMYPQCMEKLEGWARSENRWARRAAAVTLIVPAKKGEYLEHIFKIADILLVDQDDLVQKGYGWMLKAASEAHQEEVFAYVMKNKAEMPRTALRYAIEKMPNELKRQAMAR